MSNEEVTVFADRGYVNGEQVLTCANTVVQSFILQTLTSSSRGVDSSPRGSFFYDMARDHYICLVDENKTRTKDYNITTVLKLGVRELIWVNARLVASSINCGSL
jgi:hypothetical protein